MATSAPPSHAGHTLAHPFASTFGDVFAQGHDAALDALQQHLLAAAEHGDSHDRRQAFGDLRALRLAADALQAGFVQVLIDRVDAALPALAGADAMVRRYGMLAALPPSAVAEAYAAALYGALAEGETAEFLRGVFDRWCAEHRAQFVAQVQELAAPGSAPASGATTWTRAELRSALEAMQQRIRADSTPVPAGSLLGELQAQLRRLFGYAAERNTIPHEVADELERVDRAVDDVFARDGWDAELPRELYALRIALARIALSGGRAENRAAQLASQLLGGYAAVITGSRGDVAGRAETQLLLKRTLTHVAQASRGSLAGLEWALVALGDSTQRRLNQGRPTTRWTPATLRGRARLSEAWRAVIDALEPLASAPALPALVAEFLRRPWAQYLSLVYLGSGVDSDRWRAAVGVAQELARRASSANADSALDPLALAAALKEGLVRVGYAGPDATRLWSALDELMERVRRGQRPDPAAVRLVTQIGPTLQTALSELSEARAAARPRVNVAPPAPAEAIAPPPRVAPAPPVQSSAPPLQISEPPAPAPRAAMPALAQGDWIELAVAGQPHQPVKLSWFSLSGRTYLFVDRSGNKAAELSEADLERGFASGQARLPSAPDVRAADGSGRWA